MRVGRRAASAVGLACLLAALEGSSLAPRFSRSLAMAAPSCPVITVGGPPSFVGVFAGAYFYQSFSAFGGAFPTTFTLTGTQPPGTTLSPAGTLLGTLTTAGTFNFTVTATDANGCTGGRTFDLPVAPGMTPGTLPNTLVSTAYNQTLTGIGGAPYSFFVVSGFPPSGLSLSPAGVLSGTTGMTATTSSFTVKATGAAPFGNRYQIAVQSSATCSLEVTNTTTTGGGSLRSAIDCANRHLNAGGPDTITFNIPAASDVGCNSGTGVCTIVHGSGPNALPDIIDPVFIDGRSQPGSSANTLAIGNDAAIKIVLNGANAGGRGLVFGANAGGSRVRGLAINGWGTAIAVEGGTGTTIEGNYIGTDVSGTVAQANSFIGVSITDAVGTTIGGGTPAARNVIAANNGSGILISGGGLNGPATGNIVKGNYIGVDRTGNVALANSGPGITLTHADNTHIGGTGANDGNVIARNQNGGVRIQGESNGTVIEGNRINRFANNSSASGGGQSIFITEGSSFTQIGGTEPGAGNIISNSSGTAVIIASGIGNAISRNTLFANAEVPINLWATEVRNLFQPLPNDPCDADTGGNALQNYPVLTSVSSVGGTTTIQGSLDSAPGTPFTLEFYTNTVGERIEVFDSAVVTTNGGCVADFIFTSSAPIGQFVAVTATDPGGNTSELSEPGFVNADFSILKEMSPNPVGTGSNVTISLQASYAGPAPSNAVTVNDTLPSSLTFVSISPAAGWNCTTPLVGNAGAIECTTSSMAPEETAAFSIVATVDCAVANNTSIGSSAIISSATTDSDASNNSSTASTVANNALPTITAPPPLSLPNDPGQCGRTISNAVLGTPIASDSCSTPTVTVSGVPAGNFFPKGKTTITWKATDGAGAFRTATQDITVSDAEAPFVLVDPVVTRFSGPGAGNGLLSGAYGAALDGAGNLYVADTGNNRIQKFGPTGTYLTKWGAAGSGNGQFSSPSGVAVDENGNVYIADTGNNRVQKFTATGVFLAAWGTLGNGDGQLNSPYGIAVNRGGYVYVADTYNHRIQEFSSGGVFVTKWGTEGSGDGQFEYPIAVAVDPSQNQVYVADTNNDRIQMFEPWGQFILAWGTSGASHGQLNRPYGIAADGRGNLLVADSINNRIERYNVVGGFQGSVGTAGTGAGQFAFPIGVAADPQNLYVVDWGNNRVHRFTGEDVRLLPGTVSLTGVFTDNCVDTHSGAAMLTDAGKVPELNLSQALSITENPGRFTDSVVVALPGLYASSVQICDSALNCRTTTTNAAGQSMRFAAYQTSEPSISGSGQIAVAAGSLPSNAGASGAASFTFKASIPKGQLAPNGTLDFAFPAGAPSFTIANPIDMVWLQVAGPRGQFKAGAVCTVLGAAMPCQILLTGIDGDQASGGGLDRFRIKATGRQGAILFDSGLGAPDSANPQGVSTDPSNSIDIAKFLSTTGLSSSVNPSTPGQTVTFTATVTSSGGTPTGNVKFKDGNAVLATVALNASGVATYTTSALAKGVHTISVDYAGTPNFGKSSATLAQSVSVASITTLTSSINPTWPGQTTQLTATVTGAAGKASGTIRLWDNGVLFATAALNPRGEYSMGYSSAVPGYHLLKAEYLGGGAYDASQATLYQLIQKLPSTTTVTVTPSPSLSGQSVKLAVTVGGSARTPTGVVTLFDEFNGTTTQLAVDALDNKGKMSFNTSLLQFGAHTISARYDGDATFDGSTASVAHAVTIFVTKWSGAQFGALNKPQGIAVDNAKNVFVAATENHSIVRFKSDGKYFTSWGAHGSGPGAMSQPRGVAVDYAGNVYVADSGNNRIQKFSSKGDFLMAWGTQGTGDGQFRTPCAVAVDAQGMVYVADTFNDRVQKFTSTGTFVRKWGGIGGGAGQMFGPFGIAADAFGYVYVADTDNYRIQKFTASGDFVTMWGSGGNNLGQFNGPTGVAVDAAGNVYVSEVFTSRIQKFTSSGVFLATFGSPGFGDGEFNGPNALAIDVSGFIYVIDTNNGRIQKFVSP